MKQLKIIFLFAFMAINLIAQRQEFIGIGAVSELYHGGMLYDNISLLYENQLHKHHGFAMELNRRNGNTNMTMTDNSSLHSYTFRIQENYLSLPVMYKFYSKIVDISTGFNVDYYVGWKDLSSSNSVELTSHSITPRLTFGWNFKISKTIPLYNRFYLEPSVFYNPALYAINSYYGVSLKLKYELKK